ncbi:prepilin-type N-terminal cleavage/methylation domain-containing protein [Candidatus Saccharibacteria bacterium]|nr:prepilin-type N-terminal cleavage/methylation domain-containing protein [Candidatus Saccharibacteria bacterium]
MWARSRQSGFTIVELLIVIVIIGILAVLAIGAFSRAQEQARAATAQSDLKASAKQLEQAKADAGTYPATSSGLPASPNTTYQYAYDAVADTYCLTGNNGSSTFRISSDNRNPASGVCPGHGVGGATPITNLMPNPKMATNTTGWSPRMSTGGTGTGTQLTGQTTFTPSVTTAYRVTLTAVPASWWRMTTQGIPVTVGQSYTLSSWIRPSATLSTGVILIWKNSSNSIITENGAASSHVANTWERRSVTATAPAAAVTLQVDIGAPGSAAIGTSLDATGVMVEQGSTLTNYADGDTAGWIWNGTANASSSTGSPQ